MKKVILVAVGLILTFAVNAQNDCTLPAITQVTGAGTYCPDEEVTLNLTGELNDADEWTWYSDRCGGNALGTGTSLTVSVNATVSYFVRGTGGCVPNNGDCVEVIVKLDDEGPVVTNGPEDMTVENDAGTCEAIVEFEDPTGEDNCSEEIEVIQTEGLVSGSAFPVGTTTVSYELKDDLDNISIHSFTITVLDSELPQIACIESIESDNDPGECGAVVSYEAPVGTDNCEGVSTELTEGLGSGSFYPVGTTIDTYTVTDAAGNVASCSVSITVNDVEPPVITLSDRKKVSLWPPNHKHHDLIISEFIESVWDNCGEVSIDDVVIEELSSDEANNGSGDGNTIDDILISDDCKTAQVLSERSGGGNGRVYMVSLGVKDIHGNIGRAEFTLEVPHDQGKGKNAINDGKVFSVVGCDLSDGGDNSGRTDESGRVEVGLGTFPNPFNQSFDVEFTPEFDDEISVELYSMMGKKIADLHQEQVQANKPYKWNITTSDLEDELYILVIWGKKTYGTKRIYRKD